MKNDKKSIKLIRLNGSTYNKKDYPELFKAFDKHIENYNNHNDKTFNLPDVNIEKKSSNG